MALLCGACGVGQWGESDGGTVAQGRALPSAKMARGIKGVVIEHLLPYSNVVRHAPTLAGETSAVRLAERVSDIHAKVDQHRRQLEKIIARTADYSDTLLINTEFQQLSLALKNKLSYIAADGEGLLAIDFPSIGDELAKLLLKNLQELDTMLSSPLRGMEPE